MLNVEVPLDGVFITVMAGPISKEGRFVFGLPRSRRRGGRRCSIHGRRWIVRAGRHSTRRLHMAVMPSLVWSITIRGAGRRAHGRLGMRRRVWWRALAEASVGRCRRRRSNLLRPTMHRWHWLGARI